MKILSKRLRKSRENIGLKQIEASKKLGISNGTLSGYERDYRDPDTDILNKMAELYGVTTDYLLGRSEHPKLNKEEDKKVDKQTQDLLDMLDKLPKDRRDHYMEEIKAYVKISTHANDKGED